MLVLVIVTAVVAATRGVWSPCGLSMLSALNPVSETARGHRFGVTAGWYVVGATIGGAVLGAMSGVLAYAVGRLDPPAWIGWVLVLVAAVVALVSDSGRTGWSLPINPRQVDVRWLTTYRRWIYAGGFGLQIGAGVATYIMTAAVYLTVVFGALTGDVATALAGGLTFGLIRGLAILLAAPAGDPRRLRALLARVDALAGPSVVAVCGFEAGVAAVAIGYVVGPVVGPVGGLAAAGVLLALIGVAAAVPGLRFAPVPAAIGPKSGEIAAAAGANRNTG